VNAVQWTGRETTNPATHAQIIHVSIERALFKDFLELLKDLITKRKLSRLWIDEAHLVLLHERFRSVFNDVRALRAPVQMVLTTATLPPALEPALWGAFGTRPGLVIRDLCERSNCAHAVRSVHPSCAIMDMVAIVKARVRDYLPEDRGIVFVNTVTEAKELAELLGVDCFTGRQTEVEGQQVYRRWYSGTHKVVVGTTALTHGVDHPNVVDVWNFRRPYDLITAAQGLGRGGRRGQRYNYTLVDAGVTPISPDNVPYGAEVIAAMLNDGSNCRRLFFSLFLNGPGAGQTCSTMPGAAFCDACLSRLSLFREADVQRFPNGIVPDCAGQPSLPDALPPRRDPSALRVTAHEEAAAATPHPSAASASSPEGVLAGPSGSELPPTSAYATPFAPAYAHAVVVNHPEKANEKPSPFAGNRMREYREQLERARHQA
jgi:hypothetical protein